MTYTFNPRQRRKSRRWAAKFPLDAYALGAFDFRDPIDEREFRSYLRDWHGGPKCKRLPVGTEVWHYQGG
jgi:hypothetical protein